MTYYRSCKALQDGSALPSAIAPGSPILFCIKLICTRTLHPHDVSASRRATGACHICAYSRHSSKGHLGIAYARALAPASPMMLAARLWRASRGRSGKLTARDTTQQWGFCTRASCLMSFSWRQYGRLAESTSAPASSIPSSLRLRCARDRTPGGRGCRDESGPSTARPCVCMLIREGRHLRALSQRARDEVSRKTLVRTRDAGRPTPARLHKSCVSSAMPTEQRRSLTFTRVGSRFA